MGKIKRIDRINGKAKAIPPIPPIHFIPVRTIYCAISVNLFFALFFR